MVTNEKLGETESLLITVQNNVIRTIYIKAKIDNMLVNSKYRLCVYRDDTVNHMSSEYCKLQEKEYKVRYDWVRKFNPLEIMQETEISPYWQMV